MVGKILDGKYRIDRQLGAGGMGNVYLATHLGTTRVVAVKVIAPKWAADPQFLARFQREAQACGRLRHLNIVNVTDFGIAASGRVQIPYLVMELLDGQTLADFQQGQARPPLPLVADLLDQVALALEEAHSHGIVHRDLKPENIWLEPNGRGGYTVKVLDFGVAKMKMTGDTPLPPAPEGGAPGTGGDVPPVAPESETVVMDVRRENPPAPMQSAEAETIAMARDPSDPSSGAFASDGGHTMPGSLVGTPAYMSPEQALGLEIDFRSDIYSLGVVAYSLVCGELPFTGKTSELLEFHRTGSPKPPDSAKKVPRDVTGAMLAALARDPANRPASAMDFARRFHNGVDAEFFALRRSRAFLFQHFVTFACLMLPLYTVLLSVIALTESYVRKHFPASVLRTALIPLMAAVLLILSDNALRATAALIAMDERVRIRRFISWRVFWRLVKAMPALVRTQARSMFLFGSGWLVRDCLWPVLCVVENLSGKAAVMRSRSLMTGLNSAGRALAIRHVALAVLAIADVVESLSFRTGNGHGGQSGNAVWFPIFAVFAAAPLYLYDRTAAQKEGPLLQLNRTPEVQITARPLSLSSMIWLAAVAIYLIYEPLKLWFFRGR
ncbi:MAG TPA: serine/threonine-protein kinase [Bryobacteraceae bacterium]|nr:serine/threonine-protein kinase [Bryobacteraceae bacterium]